jgi:hypothetical protein
VIKSAGGLATLLCLLSVNVAWAQPSAPTAEAQVTLTQEKTNAVMSLEGKCPNLPDGTKLHVRLIVDKANVEGAFFMTAVTGERFKARKVFSKREFAPLPYVVSVELILADQRQAIGRLIRQTWGLPSGARVLLVKKQIQVGTPEEEAAFRIQTIHQLLELTNKALECCDKIGGYLAKPAVKDKKEQRVQLREMSQFVRPNLIVPFDEFRGKYVVLQEQSKVSRLLDLGTSFGPVLRMHQKGKSPKAKGRLDGIRAELVRMQDELKSRLPKKDKGDSK